MRVLQIHWALPPTTGGVESHVVDLTTGLAARGCDVTVLTGEPQPLAIPGAEVVRCDALDLDVVRGGNVQGPALIAQLRNQIGGLIKDLDPDVIHGHNLHHFHAGPALVIDEIARGHGLGIHHTFHETWPDLLHDRPVYRSWAGNYAVSRFVRDECARRLGFAPDLLPLGVDLGAFHVQRAPFSDPRTPVILHPARMLPWKGVHISVRMLALLAEQGVEARLLLTDTAKIADWGQEMAAYREKILTLIDTLGLSDQVELRSTAYRDMPALYEEADIVVYPTIAAEPYGLVPLEAMSTQRPVVASRCGGIPETVVEGVTGYLVDPDDAAALAAVVKRLLEDPEAARAMGRAGRRHATARFNLDDYIDAMLANYRRASIAK